MKVAHRGRAVSGSSRRALESLARDTGTAVIGAALGLVLAAGPALALPGGEVRENDLGAPSTQEECVENPVPGGVLCADEIVVVGRAPAPQPSGPDASVAPSAGLSPGAGTDANKHLDRVLERIEQWVSRHTCADIIADLTDRLTQAIEDLKAAQATQNAVLADPKSTPQQRADVLWGVQDAQERVNRAANVLYDWQLSCID